MEVNRGRVTTFTFDRDVIEARRRIERDFPEIKVLWDQHTREHLIVEHCRDGTDRLVFATPRFHEDLIRARLADADSLRTDPFEAVEKYNEAVEKDQERRIGEKIQEAGEKLAFAFAQDGVTVRPRMTPLSVQLRKARRLQNYDIPNR